MWALVFVCVGVSSRMIPSCAFGPDNALPHKEAKPKPNTYAAAGASIVNANMPMSGAAGPPHQLEASPVSDIPAEQIPVSKVAHKDDGWFQQECSLWGKLGSF